MSKGHTKKLLGGFALIVLLCVLPWQVVADPIETTYKKLRIFAHVLSFVQNNYVDDVDEEGLVHDAIRGLLRSLDPHSVYMTPSEYQKTQEDTSGAYGGLGIVISQIKSKGFIIKSVAPDSPAAHAGLTRGDRLLAVDGLSVKEMTLRNLSSKIRGLPDTPLKLLVLRKGWSKEREVLLIRKRVQMASVTHQLIKRSFGYIHIRSFQEKTALEVRTSLKELKKRTQKKLKGLILDLRDNPGGLFDQGVAVADLFLNDGLIVTTESRHERHREVQYAHAEETEKSLPMIVLINRHTASSSEIVAGALKTHQRAKLLGEHTYGKGSVQTLIGLEDGSGLKITVARYKTPDGATIPPTGIQPDHVLAEPAPGTPYANLLEDPWIDAALDHLKNR
jgi:carboxyl-terminal processing protease